MSHSHAPAEKKTFTPASRPLVQRSPGVPTIVHDVLRSPGQSLDSATRAFMEPRFGQDFSQVRVHSDATAAESARSLNALAYTVGKDIVFGAGQYAPRTSEGQRLLAHELVHTVQQCHSAGLFQPDLKIGDLSDSFEREADSISESISTNRVGSMASGSRISPLVQRKCRSDLSSPAPDCTPSEADIVGWQFLFKVGCDDLLDGEKTKLNSIRTGSKVNIHGYASIEGDPGFNLDLSCHRANKVADLIRSERPDLQVEGVFKHGASPQPHPGVIPDPHPRAFWRSVIVEEKKVTVQPQPKTSCGPDVTDWFIAQVVAGKKNVKVLSVRNQLDIGAFFAQNVAPAGQIISQEVVEGAVLEKVGEAWKSAGKPQPTAEANAQEAQAQLGLLELETAKMAALSGDTNAITMLTALRDASLEWKALVGTRKPFDFKNDPTTMQNPMSDHCPDADCSGTITMCPGSPGINCYEKDLPGNLFYATVGAFVGFSENALQLGSQWAQLTSTKTWDPQGDTQMISFGYNLPHPLTRASFCSALQSAKTSFPQHSCGDCNEQTAAAIINP